MPVSAFLTVCAGVSLPSLPSFLTVTLPLSSTVMSSSVKFRSGFAFLTASLIFPCSASVTFSGSATSTGVGAFTPSLLSSCLTVFSAGMVPRTLPSLSLTVTAPSSATSTFAPSGKVGLAFLTASSTAFLFSGVNALALSTVIGFSGALMPVSASAGFFALAFPASDSLFEPSLALALTSVSSFTLSAGIVTTPEAGSIFRSLPSGNDQFP